MVSKKEKLKKLKLRRLMLERLEQLQKQELEQLIEWSMRLLSVNKIGELLRPNKDSKQSTNLSFYTEKLPKGAGLFVKDEELEAHLIDYRQKWYENKSLSWQTHAIVWLKTWHYILVQIVWNQLLVNIKNYFEPLHKPRLPRN